MNKILKTNGFSLIEMAIVLLVFGLIIGGLMGPMKLQLENMERKETVSTLDDIKKAIVGFAVRTGRIPCPDTDNDGQEDVSSGDCDDADGGIPWVTLGVGQMDAWKRPFTYRVAEDFADSTDGTGCGTAITGISFETCSGGDIDVLDSSGGSLVATNLPAVIVSHGESWASAAADTNEQENLDTDASFVDKEYAKLNGAGYDDIVAWVNLNNLIGKLVAAGTLTGDTSGGNGNGNGNNGNGNGNGGGNGNGNNGNGNGNGGGNGNGNNGNGNGNN